MIDLSSISFRIWVFAVLIGQSETYGLFTWSGPKNSRNIREKYAKNLRNIREKYAKNLRKICEKIAKKSQKIKIREKFVKKS